jgi:hypothetical protein
MCIFLFQTFGFSILSAFSIPNWPKSYNIGEIESFVESLCFSESSNATLTLLARVKRQGRPQGQRLACLFEIVHRYSADG